MHLNLSFLLRLFVALAAFGASSAATASDVEPYLVPVSFSANLSGPTHIIMKINGHTAGVPVMEFVNGTESSEGVAMLKPGKSYDAEFQTSVGHAHSLSFNAPAGYQLYINKIAKDYEQRGYTGAGHYAEYFKIEVRPVVGAGFLDAGVFTGIDLGQSISFELGVGGLRSGHSVNRISFREQDLLNNPASRSRLIYTPPLGSWEGGVAPSGTWQVNVIKDGTLGDTIRQIASPQKVLDFVDETNGYRIDYYNYDDTTVGAGGYTPIPGKSPWRQIRVESPAASQLKVTEIDGSVHKVSHVMVTSAPGIPASGGAITVAGGYTYHTFTSDGSFVANMPLTVETIVVAGGGGGGGTGVNGGGGGGGGGVVIHPSLAIAVGSHAVTIGGGGAAGAQGGNGGNSTFYGITAVGGGGGGSYGAQGSAGGSSGGNGRDNAWPSVYPTQGSSGGGLGYGNEGGLAGASSWGEAGGGGGALNVGGNGFYVPPGYQSFYECGSGGSGIWWGGNYYAGGGGGANELAGGGYGGLGGGGRGNGNNGAPQPGGTNTGGGGGGGQSGGGWNVASQPGGSGIVIIRYPTPDAATLPGTIRSGTYTLRLEEGNGTTIRRVRTHTSTKTTTGREVFVREYSVDAGVETLVTETKHVYTDLAWGETLTSITANPYGGVNALTTEYEYHTVATDRGNFRKMKWIKYPTGDWRAYTYWDDWNRRGRLRYEFAPDPYLDTPSSVQSTNLGAGKVTTYDYTADPFTGRHSRPASKTEQINGVTTGSTVWTYDNSANPGQLNRLKADVDTYSAAGVYLRTRIETIDRTAGDDDQVGEPWVIKNPDQSQISQSRSDGSFNAITKSFAVYNPSTQPVRFEWRELKVMGSTNAAGAQLESSYNGQAFEPIYLIPNRSTMDVVIRSVAGYVIRTESHVYIGSGNFALLNSVDTKYDAACRLDESVASNGAKTKYTYANGRLFSVVGPDGTETQYTYDEVGRVRTTRKVGAASIAATLTPSYSYPAQGDIVVTTTYDGADRVLETVTSGGSLSLTNKASFDLAGRQTGAIQNHGSSVVLTTGLIYSAGGRIVTTTLPGGATKITETFIGGQMKSVTGTGVIAQYVSPSINGSGQRISLARAGTSTSTATVTTTADWLGRTVSSARPVWGGGTGTSTWFYNSKGQLEKTTSPGVAPTLLQYDTMGRLYRQALDVNNNGTIELAGPDRVSETAFLINPYDSGTTWWAETRSYTYAQSNSTPTLVGVTFDRLNPTYNVAAEQFTNDINGNRTRSYTTIDRTAKKVVSVVESPDSNLPNVQIAHNGLPVELRDKHGVSRLNEYDALGRAYKSIDQRTGATITAYLAGTNLVQTVTDPASVAQATYTYDAVGRVGSVRNALNKYTYYSYTARNEKHREWGDATYPVEYGYDAWGRQTTMTTFAASTGVFNTGTWPTSPNNPQVTTWNFDEATGLLAYKQDNDGKRITYSYDVAGRIKTRDWARFATGTTPLRTTYYYFGENGGEPLTGELRKVDYNDSTPDVEYTYNRLGNNATVTDVTGTRTFEYNLAGSLELQREVLGTDWGHFYGWRLITRGYDTAAGVVGRYNALKVGSLSAPDAEYGLPYTYDTVGRLKSLPGYATYGYLPNANLIHTVSIGNFVDTRTYDPAHDWLDQRATTYSGVNKATFAYLQDVAGRIENVARTGEVFSRYGNGTEGLKTYYGYNDRSEVISDQTKVGTSSTVLAGRDDGHSYDHLGNRKTSTHNGNTATYTLKANGLNQYDTRTVPGTVDIAGAVSGTALAGGVAPWRSGNYFFQSFQRPNATAADLSFLPVSAVPPAKSINGIVGSVNAGVTKTNVSATGPDGTSVTVVQLGGTPTNVSAGATDHGYTFVNGRTYSFGYWARTLSGTRVVTPGFTNNSNGSITSTAFTIGTDWKWVSSVRTYTAVGNNPWVLYTRDQAGGPFQVYGAQITDITDSLSGQILSTFVAQTPEPFSYDLDGNLLSDGRWTYTYDAENRLISVETTASAYNVGFPRFKLEFAYDYLGRRVRKTRSDWSGTAWTFTSERRFLYDGWNLLFEFDATASAIGAKRLAYVWGLDLSGTLQGAGGVGGLVAIHNYAANEWYAPAYDGNGNIHALLKHSDGTLVAAYEYDAFGQTVRESGSFAATNSFRFSTKYTDTETGLVYYGLRYYSPSLGRFVNRDPIEESGGINLYAFCGNNGVSRWDYLGHNWTSVFSGSSSNVFGWNIGTSSSTGYGINFAGSTSIRGGSIGSIPFGAIGVVSSTATKMRPDGVWEKITQTYDKKGAITSTKVEIVNPPPSASNTGAPFVIPNVTGLPSVPSTPSRPVSNIRDGLTAADIGKDVVATLLINEVSFKGEKPFESWADTELAMDAIAAELYNRVHKIPAGWTQQQIAAISTQDYVKLITASGQFEDFDVDQRGTPDIDQRVFDRLANLVRLANTGASGDFAHAINHAIDLSRSLNGGGAPSDPFLEAGGTYGHMAAGHDPKGAFQYVGTAGGNDFFTVKPKQPSPPKKPVNRGRADR